MEGSNYDSFSSCGRSDGSDIASGISSMVSAYLETWECMMPSVLVVSQVHTFLWLWIRAAYDDNDDAEYFYLVRVQQ